MYDRPKSWLKGLVPPVLLALIGVGFFPAAPGARAQTQPPIAPASPPPAYARPAAKEKVVEAGPQTLDQTRDKFLAGRYEDVIEIVRKRGNGDYDDSWRVLLVKSLLTLGRYAEARTNALSGVNDFPSSMQLR